MTELEQRLRDLGDHLDLDGDDGLLVDEVLARLGESPGRRAVANARSRPWLRVAAATVVVAAAIVTAIPSSRRTVAGWFGFDGVTVERDPRIDEPDRPDPIDGRGVGTTVVVGATEILVGEFAGTLDNPALGKVLGAGSNVSEVSVGGAFALWIDGAPHEVSYFGPDGELVFEGFAGNTLLWQDGDVVVRLEGFDDVDAAIAYAEALEARP